MSPPHDELDEAAISLSRAITTSPERPSRLYTYIVRCPFCHHEHRSDYWDVIDAEIMHCRETAPTWRRGDLSDYANRDTVPCIPAEWNI